MTSSELKVQQNSDSCLPDGAPKSPDEATKSPDEAPKSPDDAHESPVQSLDEGSRESLGQSLDERARAILESETSFSSQERFVFKLNFSIYFHSP